MRYEAFDPNVYAGSLGLSRLPHPRNLEQLAPSLQEHYPAELIESRARGHVLLSLDLDATGQVTAARAVEPPMLLGVTVRAVVAGRDTGGRRKMAPGSGAHAALKRAAEAAARVLRFDPAEREGEPVPFTDYRLTVEVMPPRDSRHD